MKKIALAALLLVVAAAAPPQQTPNRGRVPNTTDKHRFPRWHPFVMVDAVGINAFTPDVTSVNSRTEAPSLAVDTRNVIHISANQGVQVGGTFVTKIFYYTNAPDTRRANGFSEKFMLSNPGEMDGDFNHDIAVGPNADPAVGARDEVHVAWERPEYRQMKETHYTEGPGGSNIFLLDRTYAVSDLYYRKKTSTGWGAETQLTTAEALNNDHFDAYSYPQVAVDALNVAHIVARHGAVPLNNTPGFQTSKKSRLAYIRVTEGVPVITTITDDPGHVGDIGSARIALDSMNKPHVVWTKGGKVKYAGLATGWAVTNVTQSYSGYPDIAGVWLFSVDSTRSASVSSPGR